MRSLEQDIQLAAEWIAGSRHHVAFTGAGISTDSGLPDYRGPDGVWTRRDKGLPPPATRVPMSRIQPNPAHMALVELQKLGKLQFLISQNVDNLHLASGIDPARLAELHGNTTLMRCLACDGRFSQDAVGWDRLRWGNGYRTDPVRPGQPRCPECRGRLISSVVNFGDPMPDKELREAFEQARRCDLFFAIGSSLVVSPANQAPREALDAGARLILLNRGETPFDPLAHLRISAGIGEVLPVIAREVGRILST